MQLKNSTNTAGCRSTHLCKHDLKTNSMQLLQNRQKWRTDAIWKLLYNNNNQYLFLSMSECTVIKKCDEMQGIMKCMFSLSLNDCGRLSIVTDKPQTKWKINKHSHQRSFSKTTANIFM